MKIVIPGGTGQVGTLLARAFHDAGHDVLVLGRTVRPAPWRSMGWDARTLGEWTREVDGADVVINLAGRNVNCRYTPENRRLIMESRVRSTQVVGQAIAQARRSPALWLQASTATIYAHRYDGVNDEITGRIGGTEPDPPPQWRFSIEVATAWEKALTEAPTPRTRKIALRSTMVMSPDRGGIFDVLLRLVRLGLGGRAGSGRQYVSWIHDQDFVRAIHWLIEHDEIDGAVNLAAPNPLPYAEFMRTLRRSWGMPIGLPATRWMLAIGTFLMRTETELVLKSRRVISRRLPESGFAFQFPTWDAAAADLCARWRAARSNSRSPSPKPIGAPSDTIG